MLRKTMLLAVLAIGVSCASAQAQRWAYPYAGYYVPNYTYGYTPYYGSYYYPSPYYGGYTYSYQPWGYGFSGSYYTGYAPMLWR